nr:hypothetical protein [Tanacetum cinerariifolium]
MSCTDSRGRKDKYLVQEWRYHWTRIPKIVFSVNTFQVSTVDPAELSIPEQKHLELDDWEIKNIKLIYAAGQVLLMHDGPIQEFSLSLFQYGHCIELDHIITHLSRITSIKKLTLNFQYAGYRRKPGFNKLRLDSVLDQVSSDVEFRIAFKMSKATFNMICDEPEPPITKTDTMLRMAIPVCQWVAVL